MNTISQIIGPAIGGVIAVFAGYCFTKWDRDNEGKREKRFFANVFLLELKRIDDFIDGIHEIVTKDSFLVTPISVPSGPGHRMEPQLLYDAGKERKLIIYLKDNRYYRITDGSQFITKKNPFEIFYSKIYSFGNDNLINNLINVEKLLNDANSCLLDYFENPRAAEHYVKLYNFLVNIADTKKIVSNILSERVLENMAK